MSAGWRRFSPRAAPAACAVEKTNPLWRPAKENKDVASRRQSILRTTQAAALEFCKAKPIRPSASRRIAKRSQQRCASPAGPPNEPNGPHPDFAKQSQPARGIAEPLPNEPTAPICPSSTSHFLDFWLPALIQFPLRIDQIVLTHVRIPLVEPFRISSGAVSEKDGIVVELRSEGLSGYGESSPMAGSFYSSDTPEKSWTELCAVIGPAIVGREFGCAEQWNQTLDPLPAGKFTKTGVETALWDLAAQREGKPLHLALGGVRSGVESGLAVGLYNDTADMLRVIERHLADGYRRVKLKIEPGHDVEIVRAARQAFGEIPMFVDANGAYGLEHLDTFRRLDDFGLMMFEQPFPGPALEELATLQREVRTPVCLDESLESAEMLQRAIELGSLRIANFKIQRVGGFHRALEMVRICRENSIPAWAGTMPELGIGQAQGAALASLAEFVYPTDVEASRRWFQDDIVAPFIEVKDGEIELPQAPGLGYAVDESKLRKYRVAEFRLPD